MAYTKKFQHLADIAMAEAVGVSPDQVNDLLAQGAVALDIRDKEEHDAGSTRWRALRPGQWCAAKVYIHWPDPTKTLYTLRVFGENSIHIGASRLLLMAWLSVQNAQA
jgi:hypothetical protein